MMELDRDAPELNSELLLWTILKMRITNLDGLHSFRTVALEGGVLRAAALLNRVSSNVTTRIKQFEDRLESKLFRRQDRNVVLTDAGRTLLAHAEW